VILSALQTGEAFSARAMEGNAAIVYPGSRKSSAGRGIGITWKGGEAEKIRATRSSGDSGRPEKVVKRAGATGEGEDAKMF